MKVNEIKVLIRNIVIGSFLIIVGCDTRVGPDYDELFFDVDTRLSLDENGYYHLVMERDSWQTLHRISGSVYTEEEPAELIRFNWYSSHYWYIGDTLGYVVSFGLTDDLEYVSYDTTYVTGFEGTLVPTSNTTSVSGEDGDVSNMIAPVKSMIGDTLTLSWYFFDWITGDYGGDGEMNFVLE